MRYTKEGLGGVTDAEVKASIFTSFCIFSVNIIAILNILSIIHIIIHHPAEKVSTFLKDWVIGVVDGFFQVRKFCFK